MDRHSKQPESEPPESDGGDQHRDRDPPDEDWVHELIAMTRPGVEIEFPPHPIEERPPPFIYDDFD
ncbi:MAG: hypothetical protein JO276_17375 [Sphingomonadaceae bacterium]|nr:hypothetical protein [Sphingomonadaceae bacterium]